MLRARRFKKIKIITLVVCLLCILSAGVAVSAAYLNTNRDTRQAPERVEIVSDITGYELKYETDQYQFYFRDDRDIIAIRDKDSGYVWKTGIDSPFAGEIEDAKEVVLEAEETNDNSVLKEYADEQGMTVKQVKELADTAEEDCLNTLYTAMANSLVSVEYYSGSDDSMTTTITSSASEDEDDGYSNELEQVDDEGKEWKLECIFDLDGEDLGINVYITFGDDGTINFNVPYEEITGDAISKMASVIIAPFMGSSGGQLKYYNEETEDWDITESKELTSGYVLIPDGSGALVRFTENKAKFTTYEGSVYGEDPASSMYYYDSLDDSVPLSDPVMPVFGISHGDGTQAAFVAWADSGDEYMTIRVNPSSTEKNEFKYTFAYAAFTYNSQYYQVTNQAGSSYRKIQDDPNEFDIDITYRFLSGDGSNGEPSADYVGMAQAYREHLIEEGVLTEQTADEETDIPIRIDFLMSDSKKGVFSTQEVVVTTADDVGNILNKLLDDGITNINSGLLGWQKGGETLSKPYSTKISGDVGSKSEFKDLMSEFSEKGVDISFSREFTTINEDMIGYYNNAAKHMNTQYLTLDKSEILPSNVPVADYGYATPTKTAKWITQLYESFSDYSSSFTIDGASNTLVSTHNSNSQTTITEAIELYQNALSDISDDGTELNLVSPNQYLWQYTDRYLQSYVGTSQYVYETDTVPFLQMVLNGTMEVYAPYSNFSFYSQSDMLKMIDYNISPSFVLTEEPSYLLASTASSDYYSTEFEQYEELITEIYTTVNEPLSQVIGYSWDNRTVLQDGVIANEYSKDGVIKTIVINYTEDEVTVDGNTIEALSAQVIEGGVE